MSEDELENLYADLRKFLNNFDKTDVQNLAGTIQSTEKKLADPELSDHERKIQSELLNIYQGVMRRLKEKS